MSCALQVMKEQEQYIATHYKEAIDLEQELRRNLMKLDAGRRKIFEKGKVIVKMTGGFI